MKSPTASARWTHVATCTRSARDPVRIAPAHPFGRWKSRSVRAVADRCSLDKQASDPPRDATPGALSTGPAGRGGAPRVRPPTGRERASCRRDAAVLLRTQARDAVPREPARPCCGHGRGDRPRQRSDLDGKRTSPTCSLRGFPSDRSPGLRGWPLLRIHPLAVEGDSSSVGGRRGMAGARSRSYCRWRMEDSTRRPGDGGLATADPRADTGDARLVPGEARLPRGSPGRP